MSTRMARGGVWVFATYLLQQAITIVRSMILARLLVPADFGVMALAGLATAALLIFTETGVWPALVQRKELDAETMHTGWTIMAVRGVLLSIVIALVAPLVAQFFAEPALTPILRVMAITFLLSGFNSLGVVLLQREMRFDLLALLNVAVTAVNFVVSVAAGFALRSVWAFVAGELAGAATALVLSYFLHAYRPRLSYSAPAARPLLNFGRYVTGSGIVSYLTNQGVDAVIGKTLGADALGLYSVAYRAANLPSTSISQVLNRVTLPAFSQIQDQRDRMRSQYLQLLRLTALLAFPLAAVMLALGPILIPVLYGPQWTDAIGPFMVLCIFGLERSLGGIAVPTFLALGRSSTVMWLNLVKLAVLAALIFPLLREMGMLGVAIAATASSVVVQIAVIVATGRLLGTRPAELVQQMIRPAVAAAVAAAALAGIQAAAPIAPNAFNLIWLLALGLSVYAIIALPAEKMLVRKVFHALTASDSG